MPITPKRMREIKDMLAAGYYRAPGNATVAELLDEREEAQQQIKQLRIDKALLEGELEKAKAYKHFEAMRTQEAQSFHRQLIESQQTIAQLTQNAELLSSRTNRGD